MTSKINTVLLGVVISIVSGLGAWGLKQEHDSAVAVSASIAVVQNDVSTIKSSQHQLGESLIPRQEVSVLLAAIKSDQLRYDQELIAFRARLDKLEIDVARLTRDPENKE